MSLFTETNSNSKKVHVFIREYKRLNLTLWSVVYDGIPILFDRIGVSFDINRALTRVEKALQRIIQYENKEKTR